MTKSMNHNNGDLSGTTRELIEKFQEATSTANEFLLNQEYQQAMALYFDASQAADEMTERFLTLLVKTAPTNAHRVLLVEALAWRLRYYTAQHDYHLAVAKTLTGLPREEWIARMETILILSQSLVTKLLPFQHEVDDTNIRLRIRKVLEDWVEGINELVTNLQAWGMASAQASRILEWALDNGLRDK